MSNPLPPVVKQVVVKASPERAFARFTAEMGTWWPLASHSVFEGEADGLVMEGRVGGRIVEHAPGGRECVWGTVTAWEPARRVAFTWHPGRDARTAQDVEVTFTPEGGHTRVQLTHVGFERMGDKDGRMARRAYPLGWTYVLGRYADQRTVTMTLLTGLTKLMVALTRRKKSNPTP